MDSDPNCLICGSEKTEAYTIKLKCGHEFHYDCLLKSCLALNKTSYKYTNRCPYCRDKIGYLPVINGLNRVTKCIHYEPGTDPPPLINIRCQHILTRGKNKGKTCDKKCQLGFTVCKTHNKPKKVSQKEGKKVGKEGTV